MQSVIKWLTVNCTLWLTLEARILRLGASSLSYIFLTSFKLKGASYLLKYHTPVQEQMGIVSPQLTQNIWKVDYTTTFQRSFF